MVLESSLRTWLITLLRSSVKGKGVRKLSRTLCMALHASNPQTLLLFSQDCKRITSAGSIIVKLNNKYQQHVFEATHVLIMRHAQSSAFGQLNGSFIIPAIET